MTKMRQVFNWLRKHSELLYIILAAVLLEIISAFQYDYTHDLLEDELEKRAEMELTTKIIITKSALNMAENSLNGHIWDINQNLAHADSIYTAVEWVLRSHPNLLSCGMAFMPYYYPEKGRLFEPYAFWLNNQVYKKQVADESNDYTKRSTFNEVCQANKPIWTEPYFDAVTGKPVVTYARPIHDGNRNIAGVFAIDVALDWLGDTLNYRHVYPSSFDLLMSTSGKKIAGPKESIAKWRDVDKVISIINDSTIEKFESRSKRTHTFSFTSINGDKAFVFYHHFKGNPSWQMAVVCYDEEVYGKLYKMRYHMMWLALAGLSVLGIIIFLFARGSRRLHQTQMEQERIGSELRVARDIQMQMLPKTYPPYPERDDIDIFGSLMSAREVGGDVFDFFIRDEKLFFCIGDVSGKGVPSAMVMSVVHSLFRMASVHENHPARIMQTINKVSCEGNDSNMFVTMFIGILDLPTGHLRYCNAGHDVPVVLSEKLNVSNQIDAKANLPVGLFDDFTYEMQETTLDSGSTLFLYTDGLTEAKNSLHKQFGLKRVMAVLNSNNGLTPRELLEKMTSEVHAFVEDAEQSDDLTMLAIRYSPVDHHLILNEELTIQNQVQQVKNVNAFMKEIMGRLDIEKSLAKKLQLAVEEAIVNVINYAYPVGETGDIGLNVSSDGNILKIVISDSGVIFDPTMKQDTDITLSVENRPIGGLGILLVREMMDSINYERLNDMNILTLKKNFKTVL